MLLKRTRSLSPEWIFRVRTLGHFRVERYPEGGEEAAPPDGESAAQLPLEARLGHCGARSPPAGGASQRHTPSQGSGTHAAPGSPRLLCRRWPRRVERTSGDGAGPASGSTSGRVLSGTSSNEVLISPLKRSPHPSTSLKGGSPRSGGRGPGGSGVRVGGRPGVSLHLLMAVTRVLGEDPCDSGGPRHPQDYSSN